MFEVVHLAVQPEGAASRSYSANSVSHKPREQLDSELEELELLRLELEL